MKLGDLRMKLEKLEKETERLKAEIENAEAQDKRDREEILPYIVKTFCLRCEGVGDDDDHNGVCSMCYGSGFVPMLSHDATKAAIAAFKRVYGD